MTTKEHDGKIALITGAGSGIGEATARSLAAAGATIGVLDVIAADAARVTADIVAAGGTAIVLTADVSNTEQMKAAYETLLAVTGRLDIVVANAGINGVWAPIDDLQPEEWDRTMAINLRGTYLTIHFAVPHLKAAGGGAIVIISSINGTRTFSGGGATAYSATKAGQVAMSNHLALELGRHRIRVNAICPGATQTRISRNTTRRHVDESQHPVNWPNGNIPLTDGASASSNDIADAISFLVSPRARHITGDVLYVDGGQSHLI